MGIRRRGSGFFSLGLSRRLSGRRTKLGGPPLLGWGFGCSLSPCARFGSVCRSLSAPIGPPARELSALPSPLPGAPDGGGAGGVLSACLLACGGQFGWCFGVGGVEVSVVFSCCGPRGGRERQHYHRAPSAVPFCITSQSPRTHPLARAPR